MAYNRINFRDRDDSLRNQYLVNNVATQITKDDAGLVTAGTELNASTFNSIDVAVKNNDTLRRVLLGTYASNIIDVNTSNTFEFEQYNAIKVYIDNDVTSTSSISLRLDSGTSVLIKDIEDDNVQSIDKGVHEFIYRTGTPNFFLFAPSGGARVEFTNHRGVLEPVWAVGAEMLQRRDDLTSSAIGNKIYLIGGNPSSRHALNEEYDTTTNVWTAKADMPTGRANLTSSVVDNKIYVLGGTDTNGDSVATNEEYNPTTNVWTAKADMPTARSLLTSSSANDRVYAIGGYDNDLDSTDENAEYNPTNNTWTAKADMPTARDSLTSSVIGNKIYVLGGSDSGFDAVSKNEEYNPTTNVWTAKADMPTARESLTSSAIGNKIYALGGLTGSRNQNEEYAPSTNTWITRENMITGRHSLASSTVGNKLYVLGGQSSTRLKANEIYNTNQQYYNITYVKQGTKLLFDEQTVLLHPSAFYVIETFNANTKSKTSADGYIASTETSVTGYILN